MAVSANVECGDWLHASPNEAAPQPVEKVRKGFWVVVATFAVVNMGGTLPIPLYILWQPRFHFDAGVLTLIFAVYVVGTLLALILLAPLSDQLGRRPAFATAITLAAVSTVIFLIASSEAELLVARFLSGIAAGIIAAAGTAAIAELEPEGRTRRASLISTAANVGGLGLGALGAGIVAQYGHDPTKLVFWIYLLLLVPLPFGLLRITETVHRDHSIDWRPQGVSVPAPARKRFAVVAGAIFCVYSLSGLFSSLVPSFLAGSLHERNLAIAGAISGAIFLIAVIAQLLFLRSSPRAALTGGMTLLLVSLALIELALWNGSLGVFIVGTVTSGLAAGLTFMGGIATVNRMAEPEHRAQVVAAFLSSAFAGLAIPAVAVGLASQSYGVEHSTLYCAIVIAGLAIIALIAVLRGQDSPRPEANNRAS